MIYLTTPKWEISNMQALLEDISNSVRETELSLEQVIDVLSDLQSEVCILIANLSMFAITSVVMNPMMITTGLLSV
jgi:hypothetical protein